MTPCKDSAVEARASGHNGLSPRGRLKHRELFAAGESGRKNCALEARDDSRRSHLDKAGALAERVHL